jgi:hypothetical protein
MPRESQLVRTPAAAAETRAVRQHIGLVALLAFLLAAACDSGSAADGPSLAPTQADTPVPASVVPAAGTVAKAEAIIGDEFGDTGWIESIVKIEAADGFLKVTMDRATFTLGDLDAYARMCRALTALIASEPNPGEVAAVQFFRADGTPVVGGDAPGARCHSFSP